DAEVIDRVVASIDNEAITLSDVHDAMQFSGKNISEKEIVETLINRRLLLREARNLKLSEIDKVEIDESVKRLKSKYPSEEAFRKAYNNITKYDLHEHIRESLIIERLIDYRIKAFIIITPEQIRDFYEKNRDKFGKEGFEDVRDEINQYLIEIETNKRLKERLDILKRTVTIYRMF
ncbi:MAG: hypothetical protein AB1488_09690, partial [Nitrospirota bacterium]